MAVEHYEPLVGERRLQEGDVEVGKIAMKSGVPARQWAAERDAARARSRPLDVAARRARDVEPTPEPAPERDVELRRLSREAGATPIVWFERPRLLFPGSSIRVVGVASDAAPELLREYGVKT